MRPGSLPGVTWMAPAFVGQSAFPGERPGRRPDHGGRGPGVCRRGTAAPRRSWPVPVTPGQRGSRRTWLRAPLPDLAKKFLALFSKTFTGCPWRSSPSSGRPLSLRDRHGVRMPRRPWQCGCGSSLGTRRRPEQASRRRCCSRKQTRRLPHGRRGCGPGCTRCWWSPRRATGSSSRSRGSSRQAMHRGPRPGRTPLAGLA